jgi:hypothetical protein
MRTQRRHCAWACVVLRLRVGVHGEHVLESTTTIRQCYCRTVRARARAVCPLLKSSIVFPHTLLRCRCNHHGWLWRLHMGDDVWAHISWIVDHVMALTISKKKMYAVEYAERKSSENKVSDKYCPSVSDDLRRKILYRTYLSHQKGSCIEKTPRATRSFPQALPALYSIKYQVACFRIEY